MALTNLLTNAAGDSGPSSAVTTTGGFLALMLSAATDLTGVVISVDFSDDSFSTHATIQLNSSLTAGDVLFAGYIGPGEFRVDVTGGGAGDDIDVDYVLTSEVGDILADTGVIGAPAGADIAADIAAVKVDTAAVLVDTGTTLDGKIDTIDTNVDTLITQLGVTGTLTRALEQIRNQVNSLFNFRKNIS